ncbi:hypothetical protein R3P38DRAFT_2922374 [Favolaschia claudopus]|uniref:Arrestin-like N-terminal domain-containing protein n=1 Tax=Favolaschia claudopus TaxID=2862362 RepID=A0AAW0C451_9AGAR
MADYVHRIAQALDSMDPTISTPFDGPPPSYAASRRSSGVPPHRVFTEHQFHLSSRGSNSPWATLNVLSRSPNSTQLPTFLEGDKITGSFILDLDQPESIACVRAVAKGQVIPGPAERDAFTFVELTSILWSKDNGKLRGHYEWPFSLELPVSVTLAATNHFPAGTYRLPQSFFERRFPTSVQYTLAVHIDRSRFRVNSRVQTNFTYVPATRPPPPSPLRQLAYQQNSPLLGPEADPAGWEQLPPFAVRGTIFNTRQVQATCHLALAKPLSYTRGSPIPCIFALTSQDTQALDLLSSPRAVSVHLRRRLKPTLPASKRNGIFDANADLSADLAETIVAASWWPASSSFLGGGTRHTRQLNGEIQLPPSLKTSCRMAHFAVEYTIEVLPFKATGFTPFPSPAHNTHTNISTEPLLKQRVEIVTMFPSGCARPREYAPPQYRIQQYEDPETS